MLSRVCYTSKKIKNLIISFIQAIRTVSSWRCKYFSSCKEHLFFFIIVPFYSVKITNVNYISALSPKKLFLLNYHIMVLITRSFQPENNFLVNYNTHFFYSFVLKKFCIHICTSIVNGNVPLNGSYTLD